MQAEHTHSPTPQPGVAGRSQNPSPNTDTHSAHPCQEWLGASGAHTQPNTPARSGGAQPKPEPKHTHPQRAPVPGVAGCKQSTHTAQHPSQESQGAAETRAQTHTATPRTRAMSGWVQVECAQEHTHSRTPQPGVAGRSRNPTPNTHSHTAHPCQDWPGASGARTQANTPARRGGAQPKPKPKHTHPHCAPVPGVAGCKRSTHTAQHPSQEWRGAAKTRAQTQTPTVRTRARSGWVQAEHTHSPTPQPGVAGRSQNPSPNTHTHTAHPCREWLGASGARTRPNTPTRSGGVQPKPDPKHTHPHPAPVAGVAGCKRSTHTAQHPSQEWRGAAEARAQTHTPTARTRARSGWLQAEHAHSPTPQPGVAGRSRNPRPNTHTHTAHPCQEWLGASGARIQPNSPARSGGAQPKPLPKHTHPHRATVPGVAGFKRSTHTSAHTPQHPRQEWRGAAETRTQPHPGTKHKHHATVGNPVSIARALRQHVPCR